MHTSPSLRWPLLSLALVTILSAGSVVQAQTVLDFEDVPAGTTITTQFAARGVLFQSVFLDTDPNASSPTKVIRAIRPGDEVFQARPLVIRFTSAQARVKLFAGSQFATLNGTLTAFDAGDNVIATDGPRQVPQNTFTTAFEVTVASPSISRVEFQLENSSFASIDDLEFSGQPPPAPPTQPPVVQLTQPVNGIDVDIPGDLPRLDIAGTVTGEGLLPQVTVTVAYKRPPGSENLPPLTIVLDLTGTGTTRQFVLEGGMTPLPLGPITVTATAENIAALKGTATSTLTNLPLAVRNRFGTDGGAGTYGDFQYGLLGACSIAVYERGAISGRSGGAIAIRGDIFIKWLSLRGPFNEIGWFGCPSNEEGDTVASARVQPFERGRIYTRLPGTSPPVAFYVPAVFVEVLKNRGDDEFIGLPLSDPSDSIGAMRTWLFQRFSRPNTNDRVPLLPTTLEIRGTPPILYFERQAGAWLHEKEGVLSRTFCRNDVTDQSPRCDFDQERNKSGATVWESFPCTDNLNLGPCPVAPEPAFPPPITPENKPDFRNQFCSGTTYKPFLPGPPEWKAIRGEFDATPVFGAAVSAQMADIDNGYTHQTHNGNCPAPEILFGGLTCASDYEFFVRPLGPMIDTTPLPSLFGEKNLNRIKTEYEVAFAALAHNFLGAPAAGDLVHMTGRWIVDCGHSPYKTELHPLFSFARMKTVISETNAFTGLEETLFGGKPATRVGIWVNGWYPGGTGNEIEFDIFPPPRPSPTAVLHVVKPVDNGPGGYVAAVDVTLDYDIGPALSATKVRLRFSATRRENTVHSDGEMLFAPGRQYWGIWYLYWGD